MSRCLQCDIALQSWQVKYCSNKCQGAYQYGQYIQKWKQGLVDGGRGVETRDISRHLRRYLIEKFGEKCSTCGWGEKHPKSGNTPLEIDHIDGDAENNTEANLRLLCPNCHSLTDNYKNHNKGRGRAWRQAKYIKINRIL